MQEPSPPVFQYWHEPEPPDYVAELIGSVRDRNPDMPHLLFDEASAAELIEARFGPRHLAAFRSCAVPAMQADYLRYCAAYALGGVYVDADYRCTRSLRQLVEADGGELFERPTGAVINGFFAFASPGHPLLAIAIEIATASIERRITESVWGVTGPAIFTTLVLLRRLETIATFVRVVRGLGLGVDVDGRRLWDPEFFCTVIGDAERVADAFEGVRVSPMARIRTWIVPGGHAPYKYTDDDFRTFKGSIYR